MTYVKQERGWAWLLVAIAALLPAVAANGAQPGEPTVRSAVRQPVSEAALWVNFVSVPKGAPVRSIAGQGTLELGRMSYLNGVSEEGITVRRQARTFTICTRFGLLVGDRTMHGSAKLVAVLTQLNPAIRVAVDGVNLSSSPAVVQMAIKYGAVSEHQLEIEIPTSMPEAAVQVANSIAFQVFAN